MGLSTRESFFDSIFWVYSGCDVFSVNCLMSNISRKGIIRVQIAKYHQLCEIKHASNQRR